MSVLRKNRLMKHKEITVSRMTREDLQEVTEIEQSIFSQPWSRKGFADALQMDQTIYLTARVDGQIAGYCGCLQVLDEADITNVAVAQDFRRCGVAEKMLRRLLSLGEEKGVNAFTLEVRQSNAAAIALYEKLGFECCGIRRGFYDLPREDAVIMWNYLSKKL